MTNAPPLERLLTREDVADLLGKPLPWVKRQIKSGRLAALRLGSRIRIQPSDLRQFQEAGKPAPMRQRHPQEKIAGVYFLQLPNGFIKIGSSQHIHRRIAALQAVHVEDLQLVAVQPAAKPARVEAWFHRLFTASRIRYEIFEISRDQIREAIERYRFTAGEA